MPGGLLAGIGQRLDRAGFRKAVALGATAAYWPATGGSQRFSVDSSGNWVNRHAEATIVSPTIHTARFDAYRNWVLDNWAWRYRPRPGDTIIDVGAGVGEEAVIFSKLVGPRGRILSLEAHPATFACLQATVRLSHLANVIAVGCAVTDRDGTVSIGDMANHLANSVLMGGSAQSVASRSLDSLADELEIGEVALLKMNIEGAERLAVQGMPVLARRVRHAVISCHDFIADRGGEAEFRTFDDVRQWLEQAGFETVTRPEHPHSWTRYYIYARNRVLRA